ncbi:MAG: HIT domain-containing protein [Chloroflexota bacterium]
MERMWAPWRMAYIQQEAAGGCILCDKPAEDDDARNYILYRGEHNFIIMNRYPYNGGHLMVAPYRHLASLEEMTDKERDEHFSLVSRSTVVLRQAFQPGGFNIGINIGRIAGAGIDGHMHSHVVPRWAGDTNFMPVIGDAKVVNEALAETYARLKGQF